MTEEELAYNDAMNDMAYEGFAQPSDDGGEADGIRIAYYGACAVVSRQGHFERVSTVKAWANSIDEAYGVMYRRLAEKNPEGLVVLAVDPDPVYHQGGLALVPGV